jgi:tryptophan halogenase
MIKFKPGQRKQSWKGNVVAIGLSSGFLEPIESTSIHLIQRNLIRLMQMFPADGICRSDIDEFNTQVQREIAHIRDFIILHYKVTNRADTLYWEAARNMEVPASLQHRIDLFRETGRVFRTEGELFTESSWLQVMLGQGMMPEQHHQSADLMGDAELSQFLGSIRQKIERTVQQLPSHQAYVQRFCRAQRPT